MEKWKFNFKALHEIFKVRLNLTNAYCIHVTVYQNI